MMFIYIKVESFISFIHLYKYRFINSPINNKFQANDQLALQIAKLGNVGYICGGCSLTNDVVDIKFIMLQVL